MGMCWEGMELGDSKYDTVDTITWVIIINILKFSEVYGIFQTIMNRFGLLNILLLELIKHSY